MENNPIVSVVLPNYNHSLYLKERIESILNQTFDQFELIILDDCSTDNSREILLSYKNHPKVSAIVLNDKNTGNTFLQWDKGIQLAQGKYIWIAESDDAADNRFLEKTVTAIEAQPEAVMCLSGSILIDENSRPKKTASRDRWKETGEVKVFDGTEYVKHNLLYRNYVYNASMVIFRRDIYARLDKSFQRLRCAGDWQFWTEVALQGKVIEVRLKLNRFRQHSNKVSSRAKYTGEGISDMIEVMKYGLSHVSVSRYRKMLIQGECYRKIKHCKASKDIKKELYAKGHKILGTSYTQYLLGRINRIASYVLPFLSTHRRDKLK